MEKNDFYIDCLIEKSGEILNQLLDEDCIKYHIKSLLKKFVGTKLDDEAIDIATHLLVDIPDITIIGIDFMTNLLKDWEKEYLQNRLCMVSEFDIYRYYLLKNEITMKEHRLLEQYAELMLEGINGYGIDEVEDEVSDILWKRYLGNINSYSSEYLIGKFFVQKGTYTYVQKQWKYA